MKQTGIRNLMIVAALVVLLTGGAATADSFEMLQFTSAGHVIGFQKDRFLHGNRDPSADCAFRGARCPCL